MSENKTHLLFVYGTLKKGYGNHRLIEKAKLIGKTVLPFKAMNGFGFPVVTFHTEDTPCNKLLIGEVYEIDDEMLMQCDRLEGHPSFYTRIQMPTDLGTVYVYNIQKDSNQPSDYEKQFIVAEDEWKTTYEWSR